MDANDGTAHDPIADVVRLQHIALELDDDPQLLRNRCARMLNVSDGRIESVSIIRRSIDARNKRRIRFIYGVEVRLKEPISLPPGVLNASLVVPSEPVELPVGSGEIRGRVVVAGSGPCGLFAALTLAENGYAPLVIERGKPVERRVADVKELFKMGRLDEESNVIFGEGGAGTFSDGKLFTRIRDERITKVLQTLIACGAPEDIAWDAAPHIGSDLLPGVIGRLRERLTKLGCEFRFQSKLDGIELRAGRLRAVQVNGERIETNASILAVGHSARDAFAMLNSAGARIEAKAFQMGVRAELPQELVDRAVYGRLPRHPKLPPASFRLAARRNGNTRAAYTFCMCPGGIIVPAMHERGLICTNGMSLRARDGALANCAIVAPVGIEDFRSDDPLAGVAFQQHWERIGIELGGGDLRAPAQRADDFLDGRESSGPITSSYPLGVNSADLATCLPQMVARAIAGALRTFDGRIPGFASNRCILAGPETRCSSPVRIVRDRHTCQSVSAEGLFPAGEGAGYAGGITSSAVDGIRCAEALIAKFARPEA